MGSTKEVCTETIPGTRASLDTPEEQAVSNKDGRGVHRRALERFVSKETKEQHSELRETWKQVAMGVALRAKAFSTTCSPKDFGRLYQLIMSGAVSMDKAFPPKEQSTALRLIVNLFGSLGQRAGAIATPVVPTVVDITPMKEPDGQPNHTASTGVDTSSQVNQ